MKKYYSLATLFALIGFLFSGCSQCTTKAESEIPFSPYVEAFTHGKIPRSTPAYLILSKEIEQERLTTENINKALSIKPKIAGDFTYDDNKTIVFKPKEEYKRNTTYTITADLQKLYDDKSIKEKFSFDFTTLPIHLRGGFESISINKENDHAYDILAYIYTPDYEEGAVVESLIKLSESVAVEWEHSEDGKTHRMQIKNVAAGKKGVRTLAVSVGSNKYGVPTSELISVYIPSQNEFGVYDIEYVSEPERYIEVTFTKLLDENQELRGLAYIVNNMSETVTMVDNKLRLYPDAGLKGELSVQLSSQLKSKDGVVLGENIVKSIDISPEVPNVRFIGEGAIVPQSNQILVPFQAVYLKGVVVRVIKIAQQNMGQFLQINRLDEHDELLRVGRLVARKTIFLDEDGQDLTKWGTYAVDLKELVDTEPGAIYRVELSFNKDLSAYPCAIEQTPKEQLLAEDKVKFKEELSRYDEGGYYYYYEDSYYSWYDYNYNERNNPCNNSFYLYNTTKVGRNVLATNIGLIAKSGEDNSMLVMAHNILTTNPEKDVSVKVYNYQHNVLGEGVTDAKGHVEIKLSKGMPYYLTAEQGKQRSYLRVDNNMSLSLSSFDVSGEVVQEGLKGFIYGDRGVWRPGDTMYLSFMLNDRTGSLPADHPVVMELHNPLGQLYLKKTQANGAMGIYSFQMPTEHDAPTGAWEVKVLVGGATFSKRVRVETIKPNRLKIDLAFDDETLLRNQLINAKMHVEWLQGATARNLKYEMDASLYSVTTQFDSFKDYVFDDPTKSFDSEEIEFTKGSTDNVGDAIISSRISLGDYAPGMLMASFDTRVYEESGDFSIDALRVPFSPYERYVGIKSPQTTMSHLHTGKEHKFEVASVDYKGQPAGSVNVNVSVHKVSWYWWWSSNKDRLANHLSSSYSSIVKNFSIATNSNGKNSFNLKFEDGEWGTYYIMLSDPASGHSTGVLSYFDWPNMYGRRDAEGGDAATKLTFKTDKDDYKPGEKMTLIIPSSEGSRAIVSIENGTQIVAVSEHECKVKETKIEVPISEDMMPNAFVHVTLLQPHGTTINDLPIRMYGVVPISVTSPNSYLHPQLNAPNEIKPEGKYEIVVSEKSGREMAYTIAIVDEGLLDLTRFKTPDPWSAFNAKEALGVKTWDLYNYVVGAYGGRIEQLFSIGGDDELLAGPKAIVNRFKPVVQFDGPFILKKGARQKHSYTMPNYNGRVRMMIVAGDGKAYGATDKSVMVRKPLMLLGTLPRVIGMNEEMVVPATVFATEKNVGNVKVSITCSDNMQVMGASTKELNFSEISDKQASFRIKVGPKSGAAKVTLTAVSSNDRSVYETDIEIRSVCRPQTKVSSATVKPKEDWKQKIEMPGMDGTNKLSLEVSNMQPINLASRLGFLLGYPHGCIEQITSKAFPQLYVKQFASLSEEQDQRIEEVIKQVLNRYKSYQVAEGGFSYWPGGTSSNSWGTAYATHFMIEAESKGYYVQSNMKNRVLNNLRLVARNWTPVTSYFSYSEEMTQAYRLYVLALAGKPEIGAMNRMKENKQLAAMSKWTLAAAYAQSGRVDVAKSLVSQTVDIKEYVYGQYDFTFGSSLRDRSLRLLALVAMDDAAQAAEIGKRISEDLAGDGWLSTQSTGFALVGLSKYIEKYNVSERMEFSYSCDGKGDKVSTNKNIWLEQLVEKYKGTADIQVKNNVNAPLYVRVITEGIPEEGDEKVYENKISLAVSYLDTQGRPIDITKLEQGTNFTAVAVVANKNAEALNNVILTQIFPAGWEILNTRFTDEESTDKNPVGVSYQDIRDDRVYSHIDRLPAGRQITVQVNMAAVYGGLFYCPPVYAEAMYDNLIRANNEGLHVEVVDSINR